MLVSKYANDPLHVSSGDESVKSLSRQVDTSRYLGHVKYIDRFIAVFWWHSLSLLNNSISVSDLEDRTHWQQIVASLVPLSKPDVHQKQVGAWIALK